jgi:hypothetical protein
MKILSSCRGTTVVFEPEDSFEAQERAEAAWRSRPEVIETDEVEDALERDTQAKRDQWRDDHLESEYDERNGDI